MHCGIVIYPAIRMNGSSVSGCVHLQLQLLLGGSFRVPALAGLQEHIPSSCFSGLGRGEEGGESVSTVILPTPLYLALPLNTFIKRQMVNSFSCQIVNDIHTHTHNFFVWIYKCAQITYTTVNRLMQLNHSNTISISFYLLVDYQALELIGTLKTNLSNPSFG